MRLKSCIISFTILAAIQLSIEIPLNAAAYDVSDIALTPGWDISQLNIAWHHVDNDCHCIVEFAEKTGKNSGNYGDGDEFPEDSYKFHGTNEFVGLDENSVATYACEATVSGLEGLTNYVYRLGNGRGEWSSINEYATGDKNRYGFFYVADSQIGASGPTRFSETVAVERYIAEYQTRKTYPDLSDEDVKVLVDAYANNTLSRNFKEYADLEAAIDILYDIFYDDTTDKLEELAAVDPQLSAEMYTLQTAAAARDSRGWAETVRTMIEKYPEAAFILSGGDQVELTDREYEYTGFFSPPELTSLPVAPAIGSHDRAADFKYHFNLPNESSEYGVNEAGGDYYFRYGDALFMVLNLDTTISTFPKEPPPARHVRDTDGSSGQPSASPGQGTGGSSSPPPSPPDQGAGGSSSPPPSPPGQGAGRSSNPPPSPPGQNGSVSSVKEFEGKLAELEDYCEDETGKCYDKIKTFKESIPEHRMFMEEAIAANPDARWKIVMWHYSIYSAGKHAADDETRALKYYMVPMLDDLDVDLVLMAHDHCFTRTYQMVGDDPQFEQKVDERGRIINPEGTLYLTANSSSGSKYYGLNKKYDVKDNPDTEEKEGPDPYFEYVAAAGQLKSPLFSYILIDHDSMEITTYTTDTMEMIDSCAIVKENENPMGK